jgi:hypothetical protein
MHVTCDVGLSVIGACFTTGRTAQLTEWRGRRSGREMFKMVRRDLKRNSATRHPSTKRTRRVYPVVVLVRVMLRMSYLYVAPFSVKN